MALMSRAPAPRTTAKQEAPFAWQCYYYDEPDNVRTRRELGAGRAATWADALRAIERADGWDRATQPRPPATARRDAVGVINRTAFGAI